MAHGENEFELITNSGKSNKVYKIICDRIYPFNDNKPKEQGQKFLFEYIVWRYGKRRK